MGQETLWRRLEYDSATRIHQLFDTRMFIGCLRASDPAVLQLQPEVPLHELARKLLRRSISPAKLSKYPQVIPDILSNHTGVVNGWRGILCTYKVCCDRN
jgi:hypothetical protein